MERSDSITVAAILIQLIDFLYCHKKIFQYTLHSLEVVNSKLTISRNHILTSDEFVASLETKVARKHATMEETQACRIAAEETKEMQRLERLEKERRCKLQAKKRAASKLENEYWEKVKHDGWGDKLHELIKSNNNQATTLIRIPYNLVVPQVYMYNQRIAMLRAKLKKEGKDPKYQL